MVWALPGLFIQDTMHEWIPLQLSTQICVQGLSCKATQWPQSYDCDWGWFSKFNFYLLVMVDWCPAVDGSHVRILLFVTTQRKEKLFGSVHFLSTYRVTSTKWLHVLQNCLLSLVYQERWDYIFLVHSRDDMKKS